MAMSISRPGSQHHPPHFQNHPRRPPAHMSVSLLHSPRMKPLAVTSDSSGDSSKAQPAAQRPDKSHGPPASYSSPSSLRPMEGKDSSGESSNADKWFEKSNNEPTNSSLIDNDPPFYMRNSSSSNTPPEAPARQAQLRQYLLQGSASGSLPLRTGLLHLGTDGSSTEDFRSVIDDLTIENKKLKRRLKKYDKLHDSHLKDEKLFEVRIHGLPPEKKRELEDTLRKFAADMSTPPQFPLGGYEGLLPLHHHHHKNYKPTSSHTSMQNADSAYASMSASGRASSNQSGSDTRQPQPFRQSARSRQLNIHSYLQYIPEGLLPLQNPANMSERSKKKIVVRRLEQIFAGKGAIGTHQHPLQQQEVSQNAARADRSELEAKGLRARQEGLREARIMAGETEDPLEHHLTRPTTHLKQLQAGRNTLHHESVNEHDFADAEKTNGPEQRPTRPLDLDPHRAQIPAENIKYIRHLGFSPPDPEDDKARDEGHGWIYLNLLINMAQLHTLNVTTEFVRKAIGDYSEKFELSNDCRKVRWKGGAHVTRTSSSGDASSIDRNGEDTPDGQSPCKRPKLRHDEDGSHSVKRAKGPSSVRIRPQQEQQQNKFVYTPMFFHRDSTEDSSESDEDEDEDDSMSSPWPAPMAGDSSGMTSSGIRTSSTKTKKRDAGPIIFYNNARFCTDLSGDRKPTTSQDAPPYKAASATPIGIPVPRQAESYQVEPDEKRGPLNEAGELPEPMDLGDNPIPESMELTFPQSSPLRDERCVDVKPVDMDVSGIGGVYPADNFAIAIESRQTRMSQRLVPDVARLGAAKNLPERLLQILGSDGQRLRKIPAVHEEITDTRVRRLQPSDLPPALSYMPFTDASNDDDDDDDDSEAGEEMSIGPGSPGDLAPSAAPQAMELPYSPSDSETSGEYSSDDESDGSLDLLAVAREADPEAIREKEREYDANMAERLAEEIPAGSSAATAGGGSGFASPASGVSRREYHGAIRKVTAARKIAAEAAAMAGGDDMVAGAKRARAGDGVVRKGAFAGDQTSDDEDEDEDSGNESDMGS